MARVTPDIVLIGAMRCGTSSLFRHLSGHPQIHASTRKETHFFDKYYNEGWSWYEEVLGTPQPGQVVLEATPAYLANRTAMERLLSDLPAADLVVSMRDPVERAHSHYWLNVTIGVEPLDFEHAVEAELNGDVDLVPDGPQRRYVTGGEYGPQLRWLFDRVARNRVHTVFFEDYRDDPVGEMDRLVASLGLRSAPDLQPPGRVNAYQQFRSLRLRNWAKRLPPQMRGAVGRLNRRPAEYPDMSAGMRSRLAKHYRGSSAEVGELLDVDVARIWESAATRPDH